ncbi:UvrD-helicase domain-containing protein [Hymenobacter latericus]|uniref:UvrD-helicase domain-containing protein n=1 Tax=Hymenobacter sp. YIM 151858-1 TaxID=2987688 RepID=UPI00222757D9|nr:UvrD-helicase domain-containing protein [Hymenobacter sp. YIM 151858-1]UYZ61327.1 UvrD-helicase domain-containing protein [Hymenobacter sp. YIM 151858-1]
MSTPRQSTLPLTPEQEAIVASKGDIKINAVAGSGKTTTVVEYARTRPPAARILYLAFNSAVRWEAVRKFQAQGLGHVQVETAHSLARRHIVVNSPYAVRKNGSFKPYELVGLLGLPRPTGPSALGEYVLATHIIKFLAYFCNSDKKRVTDLNYLDIVVEPPAKEFVTQHYQLIEDGCRQLLRRMDSGKIEITHDFYLKKFQLASRQLHHDYILFDEGQDASGAMLDWFFKQEATKVIVGDAHQQIYGWRHAINSLNKADFTPYHLSTSFRFGASLADLATQVLAWKGQLGTDAPLPISGHGQGIATTTRAVIGRTNVGLLLKAFEYTAQPGDQAQKLYFEGNIKSYTYADTGASLYDVLHLANGRHASIKDPLLRKMADLDGLRDYAKQTEDAQLLLLVKIVEDYGNDVVDLIDKLKQRHVKDENRAEAQLYFSTVHRCKGLEYDAVQLTSDFITQATIDQLARDHARKPTEPGVLSRILEEINLLYVALTRAKNLLYVPAECLPTGFTAGPGIIATHEGGGTALIQPPPPPPATIIASPPAPAARHPKPSPQRTDLTSLQQKLDAISQRGPG